MEKRLFDEQINLSELLPKIESTHGFVLCVKNYMRNENYNELLCYVETQILGVVNNSYKRRTANSTQKRNNNNLSNQSKEINDKSSSNPKINFNL